MGKSKKGLCSQIQNALKKVMASSPQRDWAPVGFLAVMATFPDGTPWPKSPHKWPERKRGRPSKEVLEQRRVYNEWFHENITIPMQAQKTDKKKPTIQYIQRGNL